MLYLDYANELTSLGSVSSFRKLNLENERSEHLFLEKKTNNCLKVQFEECKL